MTPKAQAIKSKTLVEFQDKKPDGFFFFALRYLKITE